MANIFSEIGSGLSNIGVWVADAVKAVAGIATKVKILLQAEKALAPAFISGVGNIVTDVEQLIVLSEGAVTSEGLNFAADSAVYAQFLKLVNDFKALAPTVEAGVADLKKLTATTATTTAS